MAKYSIEDTTLTNIANPLRSLRGLTGGMSPEEMAANANAVQTNVKKALAAAESKGVNVPADANSDDLERIILAIENGGGRDPVIAPLTVTENGTYNAPAGYDGFAPVTVNVEPLLQEKTVTENGEVTPDDGYDGLSKVVVNVNTGETGEIKTCTLRITIDIPFEGGYNPQSNVCVGYSKLEDGVIDNLAYVDLNTPLADNEIILENVVSNSPIIFDVIDDAYHPTVAFAYDSDNRMLDSVIYGIGQQTWVVYIPQDAQGIFDITLTEEQREPAEPEPDEPDDAVTSELGTAKLGEMKLA